MHNQGVGWATIFNIFFYFWADRHAQRRGRKKSDVFENNKIMGLSWGLLCVRRTMPDNNPYTARHCDRDPIKYSSLFIVVYAAGQLNRAHHWHAPIMFGRNGKRLLFMPRALFVPCDRQRDVVTVVAVLGVALSRSFSVLILQD